MSRDTRPRSHCTECGRTIINGWAMCDGCTVYDPRDLRLVIIRRQIQRSMPLNKRGRRDPPSITEIARVYGLPVSPDTET